MFEMFLADNPTVPTTAIVNTLDGVTTVLAAFIFVCLIMPALVKHRPQFYMAMACVIGIILLHTLMLMVSASTFVLTLGGVLTGFLQVFGFILLVLCVGGLTVQELGGEMARAYEVMRRGETEKEVIIPLSDAASAPKAAGQTPPRKVYKVNKPAGAEEQLPLE